MGAKLEDRERVRLKTLANKFRELCHDTDCKNVSVCPEKDGCSEKIHIDLHSAIAWRCAYSIASLLSGIYSIRRVYTEIRFASVVVYPLYHKYTKLFNLIEETEEILDGVMFKKNNKN